MTGVLDPYTQTGACYAGMSPLITGVMVAFSSVGGIISAQLF